MLTNRGCPTSRRGLIGLCGTTEERSRVHHSESGRISAQDFSDSGMTDLSNGPKVRPTDRYPPRPRKGGFYDAPFDGQIHLPIVGAGPLPIPAGPINLTERRNSPLQNGTALSYDTKMPEKGISSHPSYVRRLTLPGFQPPKLSGLIASSPHGKPQDFLHCFSPVGLRSAVGHGAAVGSGSPSSALRA